MQRIYISIFPVSRDNPRLHRLIEKIIVHGHVKLKILLKTFA